MLSKTDAALSPRWVTALVLTLAVAAILRLLGLQSGLWYDEIVTLVESVRLPLARIITDFPGVNAHPLYSVLAHISIAGFGESAWALRLPACLFGIASVWMVFTLGTRITGRLEAWVGAAVLATSYHHIWFSQNARGYTMQGFFTLLSTYLLIRGRESGRSRHYALYALVCAAGVYTHLTMVFVVAGQALVILTDWGMARQKATRPSLKPALWAWAGAAALSALAYAPYASGLMAHLGAEAPREAAKVATGAWALTEAVRSLLSGAGVPAALAGGVLAMVGALTLMRRTPLAVALLLMPAVVTAGAIVILGQPLRPRFFFFLSGAAAIFVGRGVGALASSMAGRRWNEPSVAPVAVVAAGVFCLIAASAVALPRNYQVPKQDFEGAVRFLEGEEAGGAQIAVAGPACLPLDTYFKKTGWPCLRSADDLTELAEGDAPVRVVYTLPDYIEPPVVREWLLGSCLVVKVFPATLGGGEMTVCDPRRREAR